MTIHRISQKAEIKFWDAVIPIMEEEGPLMKTFQIFYKFIHTKAGYITFLILLWSAIGFIIGMILGRIVGYYQIF